MVEMYKILVVLNEILTVKEEEFELKLGKYEIESRKINLMQCVRSACKIKQTRIR